MRSRWSVVRSMAFVLSASATLACGVPGKPESAQPDPLTTTVEGYSDGLVRTELRIRSDPDVTVAVREVRTDAPAKQPVLLLHGARVPGIPSFDLPVAGGSLAGDLARAGHPVYVMDARGYGRSSRPPEMSAPPEENPPTVRADEVVRDIAAVVDHVVGVHGSRIALVGWATGGQWLGQYAATHPGRVSHLAFYNSLYGATAGHPTLGPGSDYEDPGRPGRFNAARFGAYRLVTAPSLLPAWDETIPVDDKAIWRDPVVVEAYTRAAVASDPTSRDRTPPSFRAPSGALADSYELATGRLPWHAGNITAATLIVRGEYDFWSRPGDIESLTRHLVRAVKVRAVELTGATHFAHLDRAEHGRGQLLDALTTFLDE